ncbi:MAG: conserved phage C-terminal domain-containing protein, partial [Patescibacteria group bacterium]
MAGRIRTIKPELLEDSRTAALDGDAFRMFVGMILLADDHGHLRAAPDLLKAQIFWACPPSRDPRETLARLSRAGLVRLYRVREQEYAHLAGWDKHQRVDHPSKPRMPGPADAEAVEMTYGNDLSRETLGNPRETLARLSGTLATDLRPPTSDLRPPTSELLCAAGAARESDAQVAHDVIRYLNARAGTRFRASDSHVRFIAERRADGYGVDDFRRVVDDRVSEWGNDEKMFKFLRPKTLFNKTNFDSYVDEAASAARR